MRLAALLLLLAAACAAPAVRAQQQLPAGTRDVTAPPPADPAIAEAEAAMEKSDFATALPLLTKLSVAHPDDPAIAFDLGYAQEGSNHLAEAEAAYRKALELKPDNAEAHLSLGLLLAREGHAAASHPELQAAADSTSAEAAVKAAAGRALARLDQASQPAQARDELLAALKLSPETPDDMLLGAQLAEAAHDPSAEQAYRRVLALQPENLQAITGLARALLQQNHGAEAEAALNAALLKHPDDSTLSAQLLATYLEEKKQAEALPFAERLHAAHPEDATLTRLLAHLYDQLQQPEKSDPLYAQLIAQSPNDPMLLDERATALIQLGRPAEAEDLLKKAVVFPDAFPSKEDFGLTASHLAFAADQNNDPNTTLQALSLRAKVLPQSPSSLYLQATATDRLHQSKAATELYRQFLAAADGKFPDEEADVRKRLAALERGR